MKLRLPRFLALGLALWAWPAALPAAGLEVAFDAANKLYEEAKFAEAAAAYDKLLSDGHRTASVFYNLGTASYKAGQMGRAIAAYRQAEQLIPRDPDLRANLQFVRKKVNGEDKSPVTWWRAVLSLLTLNEGTLLAAAAFWVWCLLMAAREFRPAWGDSLRRWIRSAGLTAIFFAGVLAAAAYVRFGDVSAVVVAREAVVRFGPLDESQTAFQLPDGSEVTVTDSKENWLQVRDRSKRIGWLKKDQVIVLNQAMSRTK
ncbi:MAG: hypothetical protein HZA90_14330 [Verrucomicrobia bacterium]|nr:hypothetical protein [Verrucomicrobiota bacterium]